MSSEDDSKTLLEYEGNGNEEEPRSPSSERGPPSVKSSGKSTADPKICGVCGDKALGNNFNAITCESCKAFFRRNALRTKEFVCPFSNNCKVDAITRRFCQRCRLKKCFDIGMKKEWIMTEDEKRLKKQKIEQNRLKRSSLENSTAPAAKVQRSSSESNSVDREIGNDDSLGSSKVHKQPMGLHNQNEKSFYHKKGKDNRVNVIAVAVNGEFSPADHGDSPMEDESEYSVHSQQQLTTATLHQAHFPETPVATITQPWMDGGEGDSSSSTSSVVSLNQPPPLVKYPMTKKQKLFGKEEIGLEHQNDQANQMPLLSSLIRPGYPESSPDHSSSPPTVPLPPSHIDGDDDARRRVAENDVGGFPHSTGASAQPNAIVPHSPPVVETYHEGNLRHHDDHHHHQIMESFEQHDNHHHHQQQQHHSHVIVTSSPSYSAEVGHGQEPYMDSRTAMHPHRGHVMDDRHHDRHDMMAMPLNTMDSILSVAIAAEFNSFGMLGTNSSRDLNKAEQAKLNELLLASQALHTPVDLERPVNVSETSDPSLLNVINLTEIAIRRLIKMSKKISGFKNMCQEDQIALLKGGCTEMMILRSAVTYDPLKDSWEIPHSNPGQYNIQLGVLKEARGNLYEEHQRFVKSFKAQWRKDENVMNILCAITLFTPERLNVIHKDVVKLEQDSYYYLLKRYLESILNGCEAKSTYLQLIRKVAELRALNSSHVRVFLEMNPKEVEPLLIEIFDLK